MMGKKIILVMAVILWFCGSLYAASVVPDTGQTKCYDAGGNEISAPAPGAAFYGQDAQYNPAERQPSYTKLDINGNVLSDSSATWYQVKDNVTGLIWEVKNNKDGSKDYNNPHDADNRYSWYDSDPVTNGGDAGTQGDGTTTFDTEAFINALNAGSGYCGHTDWRLPKIKELSWIVDSGRDAHPYINIAYFPQTQSSHYWSSTTDAQYADSAWRVNFNYGVVLRNGKSNNFYVRAVRSGQ